MYFPITFVFYIYLIVLVMAAIFSFFNIYHLWRFSPRGVVVYMSTLVHLLGFCAIIAITWYFLQTVDWTQQLELLPKTGFKAV